MGRHDRPSTNDLLDRLFGAEIRFAEPDRVQSAVAEEMDRLRSGGYRPFTGLSPLRSRVAYIQCAQELVGQYDELGVRPGHIYIGSGGNSLAGLVVGFGLLGRKTPFVGFPQSKLDQPSEAPARIAHSAAEAADFIGLSCTPDPAHIHVDDGYVGSGFGLLDPTTRDAIHLLARTEAILVDPTYTGKAFAGLLAHIRQGRIGPDQDMVFVHTGGTPLTFAYGDQLL